MCVWCVCVCNTFFIFTFLHFFIIPFFYFIRVALATSNKSQIKTIPAELSPATRSVTQYQGHHALKTWNKVQNSFACFAGMNSSSEFIQLPYSQFSQNIKF